MPARVLLLLLVVAAACRGETTLRLDRVSITRARLADGAHQVQVRLTVPRGVALGEVMRTPVLLTNAGSFNAHVSNITYGGKDAATVDATFRPVPEHARPERLFLGTWDVDLGRNLMLRRQ